MDIIRDTRPQKKKKRMVWTVVSIAGLLLVTFGIRALPSAAPSVPAAGGPG